MATRLKTVEYAFPVLVSATNNTLTTLTQITVYLPESGKTFRKVTALVSAQLTSAAVGNTTTRTLQCRLGAAGYTAQTNSNTYTGSGEDIHLFHAVDLTSHFTTNWTGTSMTFDAQVQFNSAASSAAWTNICVTLSITYDYDDTSATQVKTVWIPLNAPTGASATSKPGSPTDTIPALDTYLPEASKVYRSRFITVQGNTTFSGGTVTDSTMSMQLDTQTAYSTNAFEALSLTDYFYRIVYNIAAVSTPASTQGFYLWASGAYFHHPQVWLTVTYEFDATASNDMMVSLILPMEVDSPFGFTSSSDYQRATRDLWVQEQSPTLQRAAYYVFWDQITALAGFNMRVGTGSFVTYTDAAAVLAGSNAAMVRNDSAFTLSRGKNSANYDVYTTTSPTTAAGGGFNASGFWIVNYTAAKPSQGYGAANHTVFWNLWAFGTGAAANFITVAATAPAIPETSFFLNAVGTRHGYYSNTTGNPAGVTVQAERLAAEGGVKWEPAYTDIGMTDPETGMHWTYSQARTLFKRWPGDPAADRMDLETSRRWRIVLGNACAGWHLLDLIFTYHAITYTVSGTVSGSGGGTVSLDLERESTAEVVLTSSRTGDGAYSFTWYDNTDPVYVSAREDSTHVGRSDQGTAS